MTGDIHIDLKKTRRTFSLKYYFKMLIRKKIKISTNQIKTQTLKKEKDNRKKRDSFLTFPKITGLCLFAKLFQWCGGFLLLFRSCPSPTSTIHEHIIQWQ